MTVAAGTVVYSLGNIPVIASGLSWADHELDQALKGKVSEIVFDDAGKADVAGLLASVATTDFDRGVVTQILGHLPEPEDWRVGEAIAEAYLVLHRACMFPWPDARDERRAGSNLPGADLVGFRTQEETDRFAFGEVKTSDDKKYPPSTMYGRTGLKQQLDDLCRDESVRNELVAYLAYRATGAPWQQDFQRSAAHYLADNTDVRVFGLLIRDVPPSENDLSPRVTKLTQVPLGKMHVELLAIYLPSDCIKTLGAKATASRMGGGA